MPTIINTPTHHFIRQHFATGFFKPVPEKWIPACVSLIERYRGGDTNLSYGVPIPSKPDALPVQAESLVEDLYLGAFMEADE